MVMKAQITMKSKLQAIFIFSIDGGMCSASGSNKKAHSNHSQYCGGGKSVRLGSLAVKPLSTTPMAKGTRAIYIKKTKQYNTICTSLWGHRSSNV